MSNVEKGSLRKGAKREEKGDEPGTSSDIRQAFGEPTERKGTKKPKASELQKVAAAKFRKMYEAKTYWDQRGGENRPYSEYKAKIVKKTELPQQNAAEQFAALMGFDPAGEYLGKISTESQRDPTKVTNRRRLSPSLQLAVNEGQITPAEGVDKSELDKLIRLVSGRQGKEKWFEDQNYAKPVWQYEGKNRTLQDLFSHYVAPKTPVGVDIDMASVFPLFKALPGFFYEKNGKIHLNSGAVIEGLGGKGFNAQRSRNAISRALVGALGRKSVHDKILQAVTDPNYGTEVTADIATYHGDNGEEALIEALRARYQ